jgi:hypothetical protein
VNHRLHRCLVISLVGIGFLGCGEQQLPETPPGASRAMIENPLGKAEGKVPKVSVKAKAAMENAAKNDPRGK